MIQLNEHMTLCRLCESTQYGYKKYHSTETMMLELTDEVLRGFDNSLATIIVVLDLSAAFDTIDVNKLLEIMKN